MRSATIAVVLCAFAAGNAFAGGGAIVVPPMEVDYGVGTAHGAAAVGPTQDFLIGIHWASLYWHPTRFDVGLGYISSERDVLPQYSAIARGGDAMSADANKLTMNGAYLDLSYAIDNHEHWRTWLSARVETLDASVNGQSFAALGAAMRLASEVYISGFGGGGSGGAGAIVSGSLALGVYVEAARRDLPEELGPSDVAAGITLRIPFLLAAAN